MFWVSVALCTQHLGVRVVAAVADNENSNRGLFRLLEAWRASLICVGCNSHALQLVMKDAFSSPLLRTALDTVNRILKVFKVNPSFKKDLHAGYIPYVAVLPCYMFLVSAQQLEAGDKPLGLIF